jgi:cytochrome c oxidase assembly protein subunit 15
MAQDHTNLTRPFPHWQRNLLLFAAIISVVLISAGGVLCVTQSIRECPDWPGCFGKFYPPLERGPVLEYIHRVLAALTGLLILGAALTGLLRSTKSRWISLPPVISVALLVLVSYFGAMVVLRGLAPGWAAVDVGSALLVVALMMTSAVVARQDDSDSAGRLDFSTPFSRLTLAATAVVYAVLVSGVLLARENPLIGCLGWPIYSPSLFQAGQISTGMVLRLVLSIAGIGLMLAVFIQAWNGRVARPDIFRLARWLGAAFILEVLVQILLLALSHPVVLLAIYAIAMAALWALLVALLAKSGWVTRKP